MSTYVQPRNTVGYREAWRTALWVLVAYQLRLNPRHASLAYVDCERDFVGIVDINPPAKLCAFTACARSAMSEFCDRTSEPSFNVEDLSTADIALYECEGFFAMLSVFRNALSSVWLHRITDRLLCDGHVPDLGKLLGDNVPLIYTDHTPLTV